MNVISSNFTSLRWCLSFLLLQRVWVFILYVWFPELQRAHITRNKFHWLLPNIAYEIWKTILRNLNYVQCLKLAPMEKAWLMFTMEYSLSRKDMAPMENTYKFMNVFWSGNRHGKRKKKYSIKDTMSIKVSLMHDIKWRSKSNVTSSFWEIWNGFTFLCYFFLFTIIVNW